MTEPRSICFFQSSRLDPLACVVAARLEEKAIVFRQDERRKDRRPAGEPPPWKKTVEAIFAHDSVQSW